MRFLPFLPRVRNSSLPAKHQKDVTTTSRSNLSASSLHLIPPNADSKLTAETPSFLQPLAPAPIAMVTLVALGTFLMAAGPIIGLSFMLLIPNPHLVVLSTVAAFAWAIALSVSGTVYWMIPPLRQVYPWLLLVTVAMQEASRFGLYEVFRYMFKSGDGVQAFIRPGAANEALTGIAVGSGFGIMSVLVNFYSAVIDNFKDDTAIYTDQCPINFFVASSFYAQAFSVLHIALGVISWPAYPDRNWKVIFTSFVIHLVVSEATLFNKINNGCRWAIGLIYALVFIVSSASAGITAHRIRVEAL